MSSSSGGGGGGGAGGARGGPKIFCKGLTMIPVAEQQHAGAAPDQPRAGVEDAAPRRGAPRAGERAHPGAPPRTWPGQLDLGLPTADQVVDFSNSLYRLVPLVHREANKAAATFSRNARKVINKMGQNVRQTSAFVFGAAGAPPPPPRKPRPPPPPPP